MFKSYQVGTVFGIPFKLDVTFLIILPVFAGLLGAQIESVVPALNSAFGTSIDPEPLTAGFREWIIGFVAAVLLFGCVFLHELGHSAVAMHYGYEIESITLWLLGGIAKPEELPRNWIQEFWIAVGGPIVNIIIVSVCAVGLLVLPPADIVVFLLLYLAILNVGLAMFNMLPAFPLDGGRVLRALLARNRSYLDATRLAAGVGKAFALFLGIIGLFTLDFILMAIALFVYIAATSETRQMMLDAAFEGVTIAGVMTPVDELATVEANLTLDAFLEVMLEKRHVGYPVLDQGEFVGLVTLGDVQSAQRTTGTVADVMTPRRGVTAVEPTTEVLEAFEKLENAESGRLPVVDEKGRLAGLVSRTDLMRAFKIVTEQERFAGEEFRTERQLDQSRSTGSERSLSSQVRDHSRGESDTESRYSRQSDDSS